MNCKSFHSYESMCGTADVSSKEGESQRPRRPSLDSYLVLRMLLHEDGTVCFAVSGSSFFLCCLASASSGSCASPSSASSLCLSSSSDTVNSTSSSSHAKSSYKG
eukprot:m.45766 g.45766  ORF g.45766 m.45766 type:complete len:105 (+) comp12201_c0_seq2:78-392(+)